MRNDSLESIVAKRNARLAPKAFKGKKVLRSNKNISVDFTPSKLMPKRIDEAARSATLGNGSR